MLQLHEHLSEFSYGYGVTKEVEAALSSVGFHSVPFLPSLVQEAKLGFDVAFDKPGAVLMLQFKLGQLLERFRRSHKAKVAPPVQRPFWRFKVDTADTEGQFATLVSAEASGAEAYYVAPRFSHWTDYADAYAKKEIIPRSHLITPAEISRGALASSNKTGLHSVVYDDFGRYVCSEPVSIRGVGIQELLARVRDRKVGDRTLAAQLDTILRHQYAPPESELRRSRFDAEILFSRRMAAVEAIRSQTDTEDDAVAATIGIEVWAKGVQMILVGSPRATTQSTTSSGDGP